MNKNFSHCCAFVCIMVLHLIDGHYLFSLFIWTLNPSIATYRLVLCKKALIIIIISLLGFEFLDSRDNNVFVFVISTVFCGY